MFPQLFRVLPNLHECFYNSIETRRKCFLFLLENRPRKIMKNEEKLIVLFIIKTCILYTTQCTRHLNLNFVFLSSYRNTIINQSARVFSLSYFLILFKDRSLRGLVKDTIQVNTTSLRNLTGWRKADGSSRFIYALTSSPTPPLPSERRTFEEY